MSTTVGVRDLEVSLSGTTIVRDIDLETASGEMVGLVGPNGSGKTTALRTLYRALRPSSGNVEVVGRPVATYRRRELAQRLAVVTQESDQSVQLPVQEAVALGRACHRGWLEPLTGTDRAVVRQALEQVGLGAFADREVATLSGGERQRVAIARALAQRPHVLVLDEPTNHLDLHHQLAILELLEELARGGMAVLLTLHDLRLAVEHCDRLVVLQQGRVAAQGRPDRVINAELLREVFGVHGQLRFDDSGRPRLEINRSAGTGAPTADARRGGLHTRTSTA
ncbi:ABC transporter ATP-binding protein [Lipingzhangella sp. LS1_29]|uniref:ABC transporter ATP-binding protein n=1 Tax=Lipingzhangella rawalii TaxID=2055835 RepID=A0ABU2H2M5_9ACTN|nr:ABC transporter ATP-binding protein [Lipingzhangella rawalii]MDS1269542.1 ABC transporter ATP-binding protein [Lipingzhangella rawalii]